jgi:hypothetical protein
MGSSSSQCRPRRAGSTLAISHEGREHHRDHDRRLRFCAWRAGSPQGARRRRRGTGIAALAANILTWLWSV